MGTGVLADAPDERLVDARGDQRTAHVDEFDLARRPGTGEPRRLHRDIAASASLHADVREGGQLDRDGRPVLSSLRRPAFTTNSSTTAADAGRF